MYFEILCDLSLEDGWSGCDLLPLSLD